MCHDLLSHRWHGDCIGHCICCKSTSWHHFWKSPAFSCLPHILYGRGHCKENTFQPLKHHLDLMATGKCNEHLLVPNYQDLAFCFHSIGEILTSCAGQGISANVLVRHSCQIVFALGHLSSKEKLHRLWQTIHNYYYLLDVGHLLL